MVETEEKAKKTGRKSLKEEIQIVRRMAELSEPVFNYLKLCAESGDKEDKRWAVEQMMKLYSKAVPIEIGGDIERPIPILNLIQNAISTDDSNTETTEAKKEN